MKKIIAIIAFAFSSSFVLANRLAPSNMEPMRPTR